MSNPTRNELIDTIDKQEREILRLRQSLSILQAKSDDKVAKLKTDLSKWRRKAHDAAECAKDRR